MRMVQAADVLVGLLAVETFGFALFCGLITFRVI
jgi:hypothetical protein